MGSLDPAPELSLDFKPTFVPRTISQFLGEVSGIRSLPEKILKVDDFVGRLETEMRKIDVFKRELPLCMLLVNDAIVVLKEESTAFKKSSNAQPILEEFIPLKQSCDSDAEAEIMRKEKDSGDKRNWLSSTQLRNPIDINPNTNQSYIQTQNPVMQIIQKRSEGEDKKMICRSSFVPFRVYSGFTAVGTTSKEDKEERPPSGFSFASPRIKNLTNGNGLLAKNSDNTRLVPCSLSEIPSNLRTVAPQPQPQTSRKQRRCWSTELHRRFVNALQQLGGSQAATPKQIRELMQVDGLTNDEVKSHLQKYRLHTRRLPPSNTLSAALWLPPRDGYFEPPKRGGSLSGSPDGPLLNCTTGGTSNTDSVDDGEDEKSENNCSRSHLHTPGKNYV